MSAEWMLAQGTVDFRNEERRHRHGQGTPLPFEALLDPDPELQLVTGDMHAWSEAHPCECEAMCECDD